MSHLEHHLYQLLYLFCARYGKCTCRRETLCRMIGLSPNSKRAITDAIQTLEAKNLIEVERKEGGGWTIKMADFHESYYDMVLWVEIDEVFEENEYLEEFGEPKPIKVTPDPSSPAVEEDNTFKDEDFQF